MSRTFRTEYQPLNSFVDENNDDDQDVPPSNNITQIVPDQSCIAQRRWNHIEDLDEFFTRVYQYHQRNGFSSMVLQDFLQLFQYSFIVILTTFMTSFVDYEILFNHNGTSVSISDAIDFKYGVHGIHPAVAVVILLASFLALFRFFKIIYNIFKYLEIKAFYREALQLSENPFDSITWHEVLRRMLEVQRELQMCIHKSELTELDIYHRILRFKNYTIAMVNKSLLPLKFNVPLCGEYVFVTSGLKFNLEMILFWGPWSPFENNWHLKPDYKNVHKRKELAEALNQHIFLVGIANLLLAPFIFLYQICYSVFRYAEMLKREPGTLGLRRWSLYSRLFLRHFNELDHEFNSRLNQAYRPANKYVNTFYSPKLVLLAKHVAFVFGSLLAVIFILGFVDQDFFQVASVFRAAAMFGVIVAVCRSVIPDENMVSFPELLMRAILAHIHYIPDSWKGKAHTYMVRNEFAQLFQYKVTYLVEEVLSPFVTPFILCFILRHKAEEIIDFFRNFTVDVTGVGDVCSFAQMDIKKHGHPQWAPVVDIVSDDNQTCRQPAECGKTELSLVHFKLTNPEWRPRHTETHYIKTVQTQAQRDMASLSMMPVDNTMLTSSSLITQLGPRYGSVLGAACRSSISALPGSSMSTTSGTGGDEPTHLRGAVRNLAGPPTLTVADRQANYDTGTLEYLSTEMSFSALYMHDVHRLRLTRGHIDAVSEDEQARVMWQTEPVSPQSFLPMPNIQEEDDVITVAGIETDYLLRIETGRNQFL